MIEKLLHNWVWKILSLVLAFSLWFVVVSYNDPYVTKSFKGILVEKRNEDAITSQEQAITYLEGETINIILKGSRSKIERLTEDDITAYVDMKKVSITGALDIEVYVIGDIDILEKKPSNMQISLEDIKTIQKDVQIFFDGELANSYIKLNPEITPNQIELTGPESKLAKVASVIVTINIDGVSDDITAIVAPRVQDSTGGEVTDLEISNRQIQVMVPIEKTKKVPVYFRTINKLNNSYRLIKMNLDMEEVTVRGKKEVLENFTSILMDDIDLSLLTDETVELTRNISDYLPEGITLYDGGNRAKIEVDVQPIITRDFIITSSDITIKSLSENMKFKFVDEPAVVISIKGIKKDLDKISSQLLGASISLKGLEVGIHDVQLGVILGAGVELMTELQSIKVELSEIEIVEVNAE